MTSARDAMRAWPTVGFSLLLASAVQAQLSLFDFRYEDIAIEGYAPDPAIKAAVAV